MGSACLGNGANDRQNLDDVIVAVFKTCFPNLYGIEERLPRQRKVTKKIMERAVRNQIPAEATLRDKKASNRT